MFLYTLALIHQRQAAFFKGMQNVWMINRNTVLPTLPASTHHNPFVIHKKVFAGRIYSNSMKASSVTAFTVATALCLVAWQALAGALPQAFQWVFFTVSVFVCGVPHGALDHLVQRETQRREGRPFRMKTFLLRYVSLMFFYAALWYWLPALSLGLFLAMTCWHFGETDVACLTAAAKNSNALQAGYGAALLLFLLFSHAEETALVLHQLLPTDSPTLYNLFKGDAALLITASSGGLLVSLLWLLRRQAPDGFQWPLTLQLVTLLFCCALLPLFPAFALYFAGWHSVIALYQIGRFTHHQKAGAQRTHLLLLWKKALPFTLSSVAGMSVIVLLYKHIGITVNPVAFVFVFLSLITLPHMEVMHDLRKKGL